MYNTSQKSIKNKFLNIFKKKRFWFLLLLIGGLIFINSCVTMRKTDKKIISYFNKKNQTIIIKRDTFNNKTIRYIQSKKYNSKQPTVVFVHGAPGSSTDFLKYVSDSTLQKKANLISIDRLGYGFSDYGNPHVSIEEQADQIYHVIKKYNPKNTVLVGWSYGGPIIAKTAIDHPDFKHLILLTPAVSAKDEKYFWIGKLAKWKATKWVVPKPLVVAEAEKLAHAKELKKLDQQWRNLKTHVTVFHGTKDKLVPYANLEYLKLNLSHSLLKPIPIKNRNHFIPFTEFDLIKKEILKQIEK